MDSDPDMSNSYRKGKYYEYQLMWFLKKHGYYVIRAPASGRRGKRFFYPDIIAIKKGEILIIEAKMLTEPRGVYLDKDKVQKLLWVAKVTGGKSYLGVYYKLHKKWFFVPIEKYQSETEKGFWYGYRHILENSVNPVNTGEKRNA